VAFAPEFAIAVTVTVVVPFARAMGAVLHAEVPAAIPEAPVEALHCTCEIPESPVAVPERVKLLEVLV
jgi:hypothetical protein